MDTNEFERISFFVHTCKTAEAAYAEDPLDADNLMRWGAALLELASLQQGAEGKKMTQDAISKLEEAVEIDPKKAQTLWLLGNALISVGLMTFDTEEAGAYFSNASSYLTMASEEEPDNQLYQKTLQVAAKAPELHAEVLRQQAAPAETEPSRNRTASRKKKNSDLKYDIMGWVFLAVGIVAFTVFAQSNMPPPPPPR